MSRYAVGIDIGSTMCKSVLFRDGELCDMEVIRTGWLPGRAAEDSLRTLTERNGITRQELRISATGYGREAADFADVTPTEITCHALGGLFLKPDIEGVVDIGGQDSKVIALQNGRVSDFLMNDKCAAGTGRFLSMACDALEIPLSAVDDFAEPEKAVPINSMCTVFAESEIIGMLAMQTDRTGIMAGVLRSIAKRLGQQAGRLGLRSGAPVLFTGGLASSAVLTDMLAGELNLDVQTHRHSIYAGAIGAAVLASGGQRGFL